MTFCELLLSIYNILINIMIVIKKNKNKLLTLNNFTNQTSCVLPSQHSVVLELVITGTLSASSM